jgi:hypothetical protein
MEINVKRTKVIRISRQPSPIKVTIHQKQLENVEYFNYMGSMITNDTRFTREIKSRIAMAKKHSTIRRLFPSKLYLNLKKKTNKLLHLEHSFVWCLNWTLREVDQKYPETFEMWYWSRMDNISWTDHVRNEEDLHRVKEERNILHAIKRRKAKWIGHILRRNCLLKHVIEGTLEGRIEITGIRGRRRKQLLDDLKEKRRYWKLKGEALDRTLLRTRFGSGCGPVVRQSAGRMK